MKYWNFESLHSSTPFLGISKQGISEFWCFVSRVTVDNVRIKISPGCCTPEQLVDRRAPAV